MKRNVLGKGLEALIPGGAGDEANVTETPTLNVIHEIEISRIHPSPFQPRVIFDREKLSELAQSISERGVIQPVVVRAVGDFYELIVGERRLRATEISGRKTIPATIMEASNEVAMELTLIENIQRQDLNPIEEAKAYHRLMTECSLGQTEVAAKVGINRSSLANSIRLLSLPEEIQEMIAEGRLTAGHGRAILALEGEAQRIAAAQKVLERMMSVRELEKIIYSAKPSKKKAQNRLRPPVIVEIEERLKRKLGTRVVVDQRKKGGRISIDYYSNDDLERLISLLGVIEGL